MSYRRFRVMGESPAQPEPPLLDALQHNILRSTPVGAPPEMETGWTAGQHVFDTAFTAEKNVFASQLAFGLRLDSHRVPTEIRRAYRAMAESEAAAGSPTGYPSRQEKLAAREHAEERCRADLAEGRFRNSKMIPILWDLPRRLLLAPAMSETAQAALYDLFADTFGGSLQPLSAGAIAADFLASRGSMREYEDLVPSRYTAPPPELDTAERDANTPAIPWSAGGPQPSDFLGNEFLLWLWWSCDIDGGRVEIESATIELALDQSLAAHCAWDVSGTMTLSADGPHRSPEARAALRRGKWPRKAGLLIASADQHFRCTLQADRFIVSSVRLPKPDDPPASAREMMEYRLGLLGDLDELLIKLYQHFLLQRIDASWSVRREQISDWIRGGAASRTSAPASPAPLATSAAP